jgi:ferric-dicitrate binding protein FerR (iron transport regulator)
MPTKKQRRREAKSKRHEYEYVLVDESGEEVPIDPAELRAQRETKEKERPAAAKGAAKGKQQPAPRDRRGRVIREPRKPSWRRAATMGTLFIVVLLVVTSFVGKHPPSWTQRIILAGLYGGAGIPFFYWMDRMSYRRWERAAGRAPQPAPKRKKD